MPTERGWQCGNLRRKPIKEGCHNPDIGEGCQLSLSLGGAGSRAWLLGPCWQLPEPLAVELRGRLARFDAQALLRPVQGSLGDTVLFRLLDDTRGLPRPRFQPLKQEPARLPLGGMAAGSLHGLVRRDLDVLGVPDDEWRGDIDAKPLVVPDGLDAHGVAQRLSIPR